MFLGKFVIENRPNQDVLFQSFSCGLLFELRSFHKKKIGIVCRVDDLMRVAVTVSLGSGSSVK